MSSDPSCADSKLGRRGAAGDTGCGCAAAGGGPARLKEGAVLPMSTASSSSRLCSAAAPQVVVAAAAAEGRGCCASGGGGAGLCRGAAVEAAAAGASSSSCCFRRPWWSRPRRPRRAAGFMPRGDAAAPARRGSAACCCCCGDGCSAICSTREEMSGGQGLQPEKDCKHCLQPSRVWSHRRRSQFLAPLRRRARLGRGAPWLSRARAASHKLKAGSWVGTAAAPRPNGAQVAQERCQQN